MKLLFTSICTLISTASGMSIKDKEELNGRLLSTLLGKSICKPTGCFTILAIEIQSNCLMFLGADSRFCIMPYDLKETDIWIL